MGTVRRILSYFKPYWPPLALAIFCTLGASFSTLAIPWIIGKGLIDSALLKEKNLDLLNLIALGLVGLLGIKALFSFGQSYLTHLVSTKVITDLRNVLYRHLQYLSLGFYKKKHTGEIISRVVNDVEVIQNAVTAFLSSFFANILVFIGVLGFIFYMNWRLSLCVLAILPFLAFAMGKFGTWIKEFSGFVQSKMADISSRLEETISGIEVVKSFTMERHEIEKFRRINLKMLQLIIRRARVIAALTPLMETLAFIGLIAILWYGGREVVQGELTMGELITFLGYIGIAVNPLSQISQAYGFFQQAIASAERVFEILDTPPEITEIPGAKEMPSIKGQIKFESISFGYNERDLVLENISLTVEPGEKVALVGVSGVGKTTLVSLVPRFYDPTSGRITIDGYDIKKVKVASLREQISIVPQETILFSGTIRDNITYGSREANQEEIIAAASQANIHDFILSLPQGYDTEIGERGVKLSGGERQRIAIARAILRNPRILILDEATSALDTQTEAQVKEALDKLLENRTSFIIAHRLSTIMGANRVVVLNNKKIDQIGSHEELLAQGGIYTQLYQAQFRE